MWLRKRQAIREGEDTKVLSGARARALGVGAECSEVVLEALEVGAGWVLMLLCPRSGGSGAGVGVWGSEVDHVAGQAVDGFLDRFAEGGVGMDVAGDLVDGEVPLLGEGEL